MPQPVSYTDALSAADLASLCESATTAFTKARGHHKRVYFSWRQQCYIAQRERAGFAIADQAGRVLCRQQSGKVPT